MPVGTGYSPPYKSIKNDESSKNNPARSGTKKQENGKNNRSKPTPGPSKPGPSFQPPSVVKKYPPPKTAVTKAQASSKTNTGTLKRECTTKPLQDAHTTTKSKLQFTHSLLSLLDKGGLNLSDKTNPTEYIQKYLIRHRSILQRLMSIVWDTEDMGLLQKSLTILLEILVENDLLNKGKEGFIRECLSQTENFNLLIEELADLSMKFPIRLCDQVNVNDMQTQLLQIIAALCEIDQCQQQLKFANKSAVDCIGKLLYKTKDPHAIVCLLKLIKILCEEQTNCKIFSSSPFYDVLCHLYTIPEHKDSILSILMTMSKQRPSLKFMSDHTQVIDVMLKELLNDHDKESLYRFSILTVLYETVCNDYGRCIISKKQNFENLSAYFVSNHENSDFQCQIILYTILNRCVYRIILPDITKNIDLFVSDAKIEGTSKYSKYNSNDSDTEEDDVSCSNTCCSINTSVYSNSPATETDPLSHMKCFFSEFEKIDSEVPKFNLFDGIQDLNNAAPIIENRIGRLSIKCKLAFPDTLLLEEVTNSNVIDTSCNTLPLEHLDSKLKRVSRIIDETYLPQVVYDLDKIRNRVGETKTNVKILQSPVDVEVDGLQFDSCFESGNLHKVIRIYDYEYDLIINPDTSTHRNIKWFYFSITNMTADVPYKLNIINFTNKINLYNKGMQPLLFSTKEYTLHGSGWIRAGQHVAVYGNHFTDIHGVRQYNTLSFSFTFKHSDDTVYLASHYPYTYTKLMNFMAKCISHKSDKLLVRLDKLCQTANGLNEVPLLTITAKPNKSSLIPINDRPIIVITGRVHPGESNASWILEGVIKSLLRDGKIAPVLEHFIFKIVPMLNPEGVISGNARTSLTGVDLNRCWINPDPIICPEIYYTKRLVKYCKEIEHPVAAYFDVHGHSTKRYFFLFGCNPSKSWRKEDFRKGDRYNFVKYIPEKIATKSKHFNLANCSYSVQKHKESTARVVMWRELGIESSYTLECSMSEGHERRSMNTKILRDIGGSIITAIEEVAEYAYKYRKLMPALALNYKRIPNQKHGTRGRDIRY